MKQETEIIYNAPLTVRWSHGLPHWEVDRGIYFVTFRLRGSMPRDAATRAFGRLRAHAAAHRRMGSGSVLTAASTRRVFIEEYDRCLDDGYGDCWLQTPDVADVVATAFEFYDGEEYDLLAYVVMGNHVHLVFRLYRGDRLSVVMRRIKSYTAKMANEILGRGGPFWQRGYFDSLVRTVEGCQRVIEYVWQNPVGAGHEDWLWRRTFPEHTRCFL